MIQTLIGQKIDQTQKFLENGKRIPVTQINIADNAVLQVKTADKDKYVAVQLGYGAKKNATKPLLGHSKKAGFEKASAFVNEVRVTDADVEALPKIGTTITVQSVFAPGDIVTVTGTSKGKGFAGVVKRHNFRGGPKTHGQSDRERAPGSIGQTTTPGRVYKGKRMAGRMGSETVSVANLMVVAVDEVHKVLSVSGLVPGHRQGMLLITKTGEQKKFVPLLGAEEKKEAVEEVPEVVEVAEEVKEEPKEEEKAEKAEEKPEVKEEEVTEKKEEKKEEKENA